MRVRIQPGGDGLESPIGRQHDRPEPCVFKESAEVHLHKCGVTMRVQADERRVVTGVEHRPVGDGQIAKGNLLAGEALARLLLSHKDKSLAAVDPAADQSDLLPEETSQAGKVERQLSCRPGELHRLKRERVNVEPEFTRCVAIAVRVHRDPERLASCG